MKTTALRPRPAPARALPPPIAGDGPLAPSVALAADPADPAAPLVPTPASS